MLRRWTVWFLLLFPLAAGVFASELDARFGGGGGYSGGGGGGGGGSGGGDGLGALVYLLIRLIIVLWQAGPVGKLLSVLLLAGLIAGAIWYSKHKKKAQTELDQQGRLIHSHRAQRRQSQGTNLITQFDPNFSRVLFFDFARLVYVKFHESRGGLARRNDGDFAVAPYLSQQIRGQLKNEKANVTEVIVGSIELQRVHVAGDNVMANVLFRSNVVEAPANGQQVRSYLEQRFTFVRPKSAITQPPEKVMSLGCPNCGSPEEPKLDGRCPSCGSLTGRGEMDWQVKRIETPHRQRVGPPVGHKGGVEVGTGDPTVFASDLAAQKRSLSMRDPDFSWVAFNSRTTHIFRELQQAWTDQEEGEMRPYVTDTLIDTVRYWMARYKETGIREVIEDVKITRVEVAKIEHDAWFDAITVRIHASMKEYQLDRAGKLLSGHKDRPRHFTEYWTMIRRSDRKHGKSGSPSSCPNCGAPLDRVSRAGICEYCNSKIVSGDFDWVLAIITQDEDYVG